MIFNMIRDLENPNIMHEESEIIDGEYTSVPEEEVADDVEN